MTAAELIAARKALGHTQSAMASALGMSLRAYQAIEAGGSKVRRVHELAIAKLSDADDVAILAAENDMLRRKLAEQTGRAEAAEKRADAHELMSQVRSLASDRAFGVSY